MAGVGRELLVCFELKSADSGHLASKSPDWRKFEIGDDVGPEKGCLRAVDIF
jgi:hypothetical protein